LSSGAIYRANLKQLNCLTKRNKLRRYQVMGFLVIAGVNRQALR